MKTTDNLGFVPRILSNAGEEMTNGDAADEERLAMAWPSEPAGAQSAVAKTRSKKLMRPDMLRTRRFDGLAVCCWQLLPRRRDKFYIVVFLLAT